MTEYVISDEQLDSLKFSESILDTKYHDKIIDRVLSRPLSEEIKKAISNEREILIERLQDVLSTSRIVDLNGETGDESEDMIDAADIQFIIKSLRGEQS